MEGTAVIVVGTAKKVNVYIFVLRKTLSFQNVEYAEVGDGCNLVTF